MLFWRQELEREDLYATGPAGFGKAGGRQLCRQGNAENMGALSLSFWGL